MKIMDEKLNLDDYQANYIRNEEGDIVAISFPTKWFLELVEDIEDAAYVDGSGAGGKTVSHDQVKKELNLTPERVKEIRAQLKETQAQFAERTGYSEGHIRNIETGQAAITPRFTHAVNSNI